MNEYNKNLCCTIAVPLLFNKFIKIAKLSISRLNLEVGYYQNEAIQFVYVFVYVLGFFSTFSAPQKAMKHGF